MSKNMRFEIDFFGPSEIYFAFDCRDKKRAKAIFFPGFLCVGKIKIYVERKRIFRQHNPQKDLYFLLFYLLTNN